MSFWGKYANYMPIGFFMPILKLYEAKYI